MLTSCALKESTLKDTPELDSSFKWRSSNEFGFIYKQNFKYAEYLIEKQRSNVAAGGSVFIDVPYILLSQESLNEYYKEIAGGKKLKLEKVASLEAMKFSQEALTFLQACQNADLKIVLMASEQESAAIIKALEKNDILAVPSMVGDFLIYGKTAENNTLLETYESNRVALVLTTSLGESNLIREMEDDFQENSSKLFDYFGDKIIVFPNPAFN
ncbi:MAG: hypothetical protein CMP53_07625 [Flavobacteriales bacterium]|nr:hypothetical protein [Flavobacteriales bacterium]|tara:strand:- start:11024 stop:11665 length:642 start_codon:yes stop_codon:yes gene_type:complete